MEVCDYYVEGSQNNGRHRGFLDRPGVFGNMQLEAQEDEPGSDKHDVALVC